MEIGVPMPSFISLRDGSSGGARGLKPPITADPMEPPRAPLRIFVMAVLRRRG